MFRKMKFATLMLNFILFCIYTAETAEERNFEDVLEKGIIFKEETKILLAEKIVPVQLMVPFPSYNFSLKPELNTLLRRLNDMWKLPSIHCPLDFSSSFNGNASSFNVNFIMSKIEKEVNKSRLDVQLIRNETSTFLQNSDEIRGTNNRVKRGAHVAVGAMAGIGLFGSGVLMGNGGGCGLSGIFGSCQDRAKENAANIDRLHSFTSSLTDYVMQIKTATGEKFFLVGNELKEIRETQKQMTETQNKNWAIIEEQFNVFEGNFHILRDCAQMLFSNQQLNFNFDTAASLLSMLYADVKSYRTAL